MSTALNILSIVIVSAVLLSVVVALVLLALDEIRGITREKVKDFAMSIVIFAIIFIVVASFIRVGGMLT